MGVNGSDLNLSSFSIFIDQGRIDLYSGQDVLISSSYLQAGYGYFSIGDGYGEESETPEIAGAEVAAEIPLESTLTEQILRVEGSNVTVENFSTLTAGDAVEIEATNQITIDASTVEAPFIEFKGGDITVNQTSFYGLLGSALRITGENKIEVSDTDLTGLSEINMAARTLVLSDVAFISGTSIELGSELGLLAANPNTGASAVTGYVNFIQNVTLDGNPAQNFVAPSQGGLATGPAAINIFAISGNPEI